MGNDSIGYCGGEKFNMSVCLIVNCYRVRTACVSGPNFVPIFVSGVE